MNKLIRYSVEKPTFGFLIVFVVLMFGWLSFKTLPIDAVPDITNVQVQINTNIGAMTPDTAETNVTYPIESAMGSIPGVETIRSITRFGVSQVTVVFKEGSNIYLARQLVSEKLQSVELPDGMTPELGPISTGLGEIFFYTLEAKKIAKDPKERLRQLMELRQIQEWQIKPRLLLTEGVAEINTIGGYPKQVYVKPDMKKLARYGIDFETLVSALRKSGYNTGGGYIEQTAEQILVQGSGLYKSIRDIQEITVAQLQNFQTVRVKDIASVDFDKKTRTGAATYNGHEAIVCTVFMLLGENSRTVSLDIQAEVESIRKNLPDWVELDVLYNRSDLVNETIRTVTHNLIFGAILVLVILLVLVGNVRAALITAFTIPLALLCTLIAMKQFNISGNLMSLGALDFGIIIDGAVIVMDNIIRRVKMRASELGRNLHRDEIRETSIEAAIEIRQAAGFGQIIIAIVFLPLLTLTGVEGKMFTPMAGAFFFALIAAFFLAFTVVPALSGSLLSGKPSKKDKVWIMRQVFKLYNPILEATVHHKVKFLSGGLAALLLAGYGFTHLGSEFIPKLYEGAMAIQFVRPVNISLEKSVELQRMSEKIILEFPEVRSVFGRLGTAEIATDPMGVNLADTFIMFKDEKDWPLINGKRRTVPELKRAMAQKLNDMIQAQRMLMTQPIEMRFNELLEGVRGDISLKIYGFDMEVLEKKANEAVSIIRKIKGIGEVESELQGTSPLLSILPKTEVLNRYGVSKQIVLDAVDAAIGGEQAGFLYEGVIKVPIFVRLDSSLRKNVSALKTIPVGVGPNFTVPMSDLAEFRVKEIYGSIKREVSQRRVALMINLDGRDVQSFVDEAREKVEQQVKLPPGYYFEWGGSFKNLQSAKERLAVLVPIVLVVILFMIYSVFHSWLQTFIIILGVPFALVGGIANLIIMRLPFSISAAVGFIALSGIAVLNGIVLMSVLNAYKLEGLSGMELLKKGTSMRLRAVLMTALAAMLGFLPMMLATGMGAEVQRPVATVVVGGVLTSTLLTLLLLPALYSLFEKRMKVKSAGMSH